MSYVYTAKCVCCGSTRDVRSRMVIGPAEEVHSALRVMVRGSVCNECFCNNIQMYESSHPLKRCTSCKKEQKLDCFWRNRCAIDNRQNACKICKSDQQRSYVKRLKDPNFVPNNPNTLYGTGTTVQNLMRELTETGTLEEGEAVRGLCKNLF